MVLDLGLGQRRLLDHRPHYRLGALIQAAIHEKSTDLADDPCLRRQRHGGVGIVPVALDAKADELVALYIDPFLREGAAVFAERDGRHRVLVAAGLDVFLLDLPFDRQAMAIPAGHVVGVLAAHLLRAIDDVLKNLVEGVADMQMPVGVGRPVVKDEFLATLRFGAQSLEQAEAPPAFEQLGLERGQARAHRKVRGG